VLYYTTLYTACNIGREELGREVWNGKLPLLPPSLDRTLPSALYNFAFVYITFAIYIFIYIYNFAFELCPEA